MSRVKRREIRHQFCSPANNLLTPAGSSSAGTPRGGAACKGSRPSNTADPPESASLSSSSDKAELQRLSCSAFVGNTRHLQAHRRWRELIATLAHMLFAPPLSDSPSSDPAYRTYCSSNMCCSRPHILPFVTAPHDTKHTNIPLQLLMFVTGHRGLSLS